MFYLLTQIFAELYIGCDLPKDQEFVISFIHNENCTTCDDIMLMLEEIDSRLERNNKKVTVRYKNCSTCKCEEEKNENLPIIKIHQNNVEIKKITDMSNFKAIVDQIIETTGFDKNIFIRRIKTNPGHVIKLNERDFYSGFNGPWIILFYNKTSDPKRELIYQIAPEYKSKLNVGEINGNNSKVLLNRFGITFLPAIIALYDGLIVAFVGEDKPADLKDFIDELLKPSYTDINLEEFNRLKQITPHTDPIFIVFYKETLIANEIFKQIAHEYKFKASIFKSNDPELMKIANVKIDNDELAVAVFKHSLFHFAPSKIINTEKIFEWIWHAHYPSVSHIGNDNFYSISHGLKPAMILISKNEELVPEFELASEYIHKGEPFADQIFASIDVEVYPLFVPKLVPNISIPSLVILNPVNQKFFSEKIRLTKGNLQNTVEKMIEKYNMGELETYPFKKKYWKYFLFFFSGMGLIYTANRLLKIKKYTIVEQVS